MRLVILSNDTEARLPSRLITYIGVVPAVLEDNAVTAIVFQLDESELDSVEQLLTNVFMIASRRTGTCEGAYIGTMDNLFGVISKDLVRHSMPNSFRNTNKMAPYFWRFRGKVGVIKLVINWFIPKEAK